MAEEAAKLARDGDTRPEALELVRNIKANLPELEKELEAMKASAGWKFVLQVRAIRDRLAFWR